MIVCTCCETAQFLQITESKLQFESGSVRKLVEKYQCTRCNGVGEYRYADAEEFVFGSVEILDDRPRTCPA